MIENSWNIYWFQQIYQKSDDVFCRVYGVFRRVCGSFTRPSIFSGIWKAQNMPGLSLPSRIYSSSTLMDGEALVSEQQFDDWGEDELLQELAKLKAHFEQK